MLKSDPSSKTASDYDPLGLFAGLGRAADLWAGQGEICIAKGDLSKALHCFQRSLETDVDCIHAWAGLSKVFLRMHDARRAEACLAVARRIRGREVREATA